mgnify:CR=1 FL=1
MNIFCEKMFTEIGVEHEEKTFYKLSQRCFGNGNALLGVFERVWVVRR